MTNMAIENIKVEDVETVVTHVYLTARRLANSYRDCSDLELLEDISALESAATAAGVPIRNESGRNLSPAGIAMAAHAMLSKTPENLLREFLKAAFEIYNIHQTNGDVEDLNVWRERYRAAYRAMQAMVIPKGYWFAGRPFWEAIPVFERQALNNRYINTTIVNTPEIRRWNAQRRRHIESERKAQEDSHDLYTQQYRIESAYADFRQVPAALALHKKLQIEIDRIQSTVIQVDWDLYEFCLAQIRAHCFRDMFLSERFQRE